MSTLMKENIIRHHPAFFSSLLPELPDESGVSISCLKGLPEHLFSDSQFAFTSIEGKTKIYGPLVATLNAILDFTPQGPASPDTASTLEPQGVPSSSYLPPTPVHSTYKFVRTDQNFANRDNPRDDAKEEPYWNYRPHLSMVPKSSCDESGSWYDVALSIDIRKELGEYPLWQAQAQAETILKNAPTKRFLFSFVVYGSSLEVCLWDRAGVITTEPIDVNSDPHRFIEIVRRFGSMSPTSLGFDETTTETPAGVKPPTQQSPIMSPIVVVQGETYLRIETVSCSSSCFGRSTRCFKAIKLINVENTQRWSQKTYLLKYFWNDVERQPDEGEIYRKIKEAGITQGVADCVGFVRLSKLSGIRNGLPLFERDHDEPLEEASDTEILGDRQLCILVLATVGRSIAQAETVYELISAMIGAIKGHKEIYLKADILHRDISTNNIRILDCLEDSTDRDGGDDEIGLSTKNCGFLIDFDLGLIVDDSDECKAERLAQTGTFPFMAWQTIPPVRTRPIRPSDRVATSNGIWEKYHKRHQERIRKRQEEEGSLRSPLHDFRHDLQSFFWVLLYICAGSPKFTQGFLDDSHDSSEVMALFAGERPARHEKYMFLQYDYRELWVAPDFEPLIDTLWGLRFLLYTERSDWESLTHDAFISVLEEALQDPEVQERRPILNRTFSPVYRPNPYETISSPKPSNSTRGPGSKSKTLTVPPGSATPSLPEHCSPEEPMPHSQTYKRPGLVGSVASPSTGHASDQVQSSSSRKRGGSTSLPDRESKLAKEYKTSSEGEH